MKRVYTPVALAFCFFTTGCANTIFSPDDPMYSPDVPLTRLLVAEKIVINYHSAREVRDVVQPWIESQCDPASSSRVSCIENLGFTCTEENGSLFCNFDGQMNFIYHETDGDIISPFTINVRLSDECPSYCVERIWNATMQSAEPETTE